MKKIWGVLLFLISTSASQALAANPFGSISNPYEGKYGASLTDPNKSQGFGEFISNLISAVTIVAGLAFLAYLIYGAFRYLTSAGDEKAIGEAKRAISHAFIGLAIVVLALAVTAVVQAILGIDILRPEFTGP